MQFWISMVTVFLFFQESIDLADEEDEDEKVSLGYF